ncbi:MAG: HNH endonuclease signature motif containing protein [Flavobacteriaceae bacterium]|nr:HNH endonuclease signature motif containing protein [Flavobacteriaceae bacterium]MCY4267704.1 HNH endonuclease signature motif containing protein [Flavobacteriaceae bacterium]
METITNYRLEGVVKTDFESRAKGVKPNVIKKKKYKLFATPYSSESTSTKRSYRSQENLDKLYGKQRGDCPSCGNHYRAKDMHVDHIIRRDVGGDDLQNLQLLCGHCNSTKGSDTMNDLWKRLIKGGVLSKEIAKTLKKKWNQIHLEK